jgi:hypothetical protein
MEKQEQKAEHRTLVNVGYLISVPALTIGLYSIKSGYMQGFVASIVPVIFGAYILSTGDKAASRYGWGLILLFIAYICVYIGYFAK